jgi:DNA-binding transcriptional MerR regulator
MQIGEVAERVALSLRTVRYHEEVGLVTPSGRSPGGVRQYDKSDVQRLTIARDPKPPGCSLDEIREIVAVVTERARAGQKRCSEPVAPSSTPPTYLTSIRPEGRVTAVHLCGASTFGAPYSLPDER